MTLQNPLGIKIKQYKTKALRELDKRLTSDQKDQVLVYLIELEHAERYTREIEK